MERAELSIRVEPAFGSDDLVAILDHLPAIVAYWDADLRNVFANRTLAKWFATTPGELRGTYLQDLIGPDAFAQREAEIRSALAGVPQRFMRVLVDSSGKERHIQLEFTPRIVDGEPHGTFVLGSDITAHVQASEGMRSAEEALVLAEDRERIAHQVNALVIRQLYDAVLELSASLQPEQPAPEERISHAIEEIESAIKDLRSLLLRPDD